MTRRGILATAVLAACLAASLAGPPRALAAPVSTSEFASRVERAASALRGSSVETTTGALAAADAVDAQLPSDLSVVEGTRTIAVGPAAVAGLTAALREAAVPDDRRQVADQLAARLASMRDAIGVPAAAPSDPAALRDLLAARPPVRLSGEDWLNDRIATLLEEFTNWLAGLFPEGEGALPQGPSRWVPVLVLLVPVLLALVVLLRAWRTRRRTPKAAAIAASVGTNVPVVAAAADLPADARAYADELAGGGRYRDAVRALYGGAARHLAETGAVRRMRTRTNLEMLREVRGASPEVAPTFAELTRRFEVAWYGHADPGGAGYVDAKVAYERIVSPRDRTAPTTSGTVDTTPEGGGAR